MNLEELVVKYLNDYRIAKEEEEILDKYEEIIFSYLAENCSYFDDEHIKHLVDLKVEQYNQLKSQLQQKNKEIERLNNNWNEFVKWLKSFHNHSELEVWEILNKLDELKGDSSNE